ncbi:hypothetical protein BOX15_Mlig034557g1 [Macrostomum lignano]|uniref:C-type lectin domain-containing protein n=1 Tax=Macrostomum lignano TaxID=282301 RepID=A0A267E252_9PLAT|nr:hypothetical protein BOX15_Mlig034557g1 [Macrostomum lignano]
MQFLSVSVPLLLLLLGAASAASKNRCDSLGSNSEGWILHSGSCYRWTESPDYWYTAEQACKAEDGHLVSIGSQTENTLVGRLTYCRTAWLGRYGTHADRLNDSASYRWTDGSSAVAFQRHDFAKLYSPHQPLVTAENLVWLNNLYHDRQGYVCKAPVARQAKTDSNPHRQGLRARVAGTVLVTIATSNPASRPLILRPISSVLEDRPTWSLSTPSRSSACSVCWTSASPSAQWSSGWAW